MTLPASRSSLKVGRHGRTLVRLDDMDTKTAILDRYRYLRTERLLYNDPFTIFHKLETDLALIRDRVFPESKMSDLQDDLLEALDDIADSEISAG